MFDYRSLAEGIDQLVLEYQMCGGDRNRLLEKIRKKLFIYAYFYIIEKTKDEDSACTLFLDEISPKIPLLLEGYDRKRGLFTVLFRSYCMACYRLYSLSSMKREAGRWKRDSLFKVMSVADNEGVQMIDGEGVGMILEENQAAYALSNMSGGKSVGYKKRKISENDKLSLLVYMLRYANFIEDDTVVNICAFLQRDTSSMFALLEQARDTTDKNRSAIDALAKRSINYLLKSSMAKSQLQAANWQGVEEGEGDEKRKIERLSRLKRMHDDRIRRLAVVSQVDIARILDIDYKKVRRLFYNAKRRLNKMKSVRDCNLEF